MVWYSFGIFKIAKQWKLLKKWCQTFHYEKANKTRKGFLENIWIFHQICNNDSFWYENSKIFHTIFWCARYYERALQWDEWISFIEVRHKERVAIVCQLSQPESILAVNKYTCSTWKRTHSNNELDQLNVNNRKN